MRKFTVLALAVMLLVCVTGIALAKETLIVNSYISDPLPKAAFEKLVLAFEAKNPNIDVQVSTIAHEEYKNSLRIWLASNNPPDVITWFAGERAKYFVDKGLIMDISDVWAEAGLKTKYPKAFQSISYFNGKAYFLPNNWYWWGMFYRKSIFQKYGLKEPKTWDEFMAVNKTLKSNGVTPIAIGAKYPWTAAAWFDYLDMRVNGQKFHMDLMAGKVKYNDPKLLKVFAKWRELIDNKYFIDNAASYDWQNALSFMVKGDAAMYLMGQFILDAVPANIKEDIGFFRFPIIDAKVPIAEDTPTDGYMIPKKAKHPKAAKEFLKFLAGKEGQEIFIKETGRIGTHLDLPASIYPPITQKGVAMIKDTAALAQFYDRDTLPEMADKGMSAFMEFWANPDSIQDILNRLEKERERIFNNSK